MNSIKESDGEYDPNLNEMGENVRRSVVFKQIKILKTFMESEQFFWDHSKLILYFKTNLYKIASKYLILKQSTISSNLFINNLKILNLYRSHVKRMQTYSGLKTNNVVIDYNYFLTFLPKWKFFILQWKLFLLQWRIFPRSKIMVDYGRLW